MSEPLIPNAKSLMPYRVLARKYRPSNFDDLIGQDVLVRTLSNAIKTGRIAHAFLLTGIRGVGKTTTARIIARALNCIGEDGKGGATMHPCGVCVHCQMISEDRHVDVLEMDAASHTGVGDIRELIDGVRYLPGSARYKIYIIDEVHMLSTSAFNALLKTLEEPPPHVKFIFATTESRKIPVTILSRCQRFDLKRVDSATLSAHLARICEKEQVIIENDALALVSLAAEGSVRDSLSLLDQAIARAGEDEGKAHITSAMIRAMLGAADNSATFSLIETLLRGDVPESLAQLRAQYEAGADPLLMVQSALEAVHLITRLKVAPAALSDPTLSEQERARAKSLADQASMPVITRLWQMLLKGLSEVRMAPSPMAALEMLLVRIAYAAELPTPADLAKEITRDMASGTSADAPKASSAARSAPSAQAPVSKASEPERPALELVTPSQPQPGNFAELVALFEKNREPILHTQLFHDTRLVSLAPGQVVLQLSASFPRDFLARAGDLASRWTGQPWKFSASNEAGEASLAEQHEAKKKQAIADASAHPLVASVLEQFPGATVTKVHSN